MSEAEKIAASLTKAQKVSLVHGKCGLPPSQEERAFDCICAADQCESLQELGLAEPRGRWPNGIVVTPLGLAVREVLQRGEVA
ncbi:hypothetical protein CA235_07290 [Sphingomonas sp. ABOLF]|uniref:hypothetical protein n=1 Tax=Sphingomonas sp. ABOLF TaxID=1985879 RepID=UPI000F7D8A68|nr:hypothetical protein [Sphingomonas sp. ABOLF]RSV15650.1 hypothetical protein CA235_07290 [Sphingomonas sp. ABOLF]